MESIFNLNSIFGFLEGSRWRLEKSNEKFASYRAPDRVIDNFVLTLPLKVSAHGDMRLTRAVETLCELYDISDEMALSLFRPDDDSTLSVQVVDPATERGTISFCVFESHIQEIKKILLHNASFYIVKETLGIDVPEEAETYLSKCEFLQTQRGSFVSRIKLPSRRLSTTSVEQEPTQLFSIEQTQPNPINEKLVEILSFVFDKIMPGEMGFNRPALDENLGLLNVKLLEDISSFLKKTNSESVNFFYKGEQNVTRTAQSGLINETSYDNLDRYIEFIMSSLTNPVEVDSWGKVVELKSHDVSGGKNFVVISRNGRGVLPLHISGLSFEEYNVALEAHRSNRQVHIVGEAVQRKHYLRMLRIDYLSMREKR